MKKGNFGRKVTITFHGTEDKIWYFECNESQHEVTEDVIDFVGWLMKKYIFDKIIIEGYNVK